MPLDDDGDIEMEGVVSSNIAAVGHNPETSTLRVEFNSGDTWEYSGVSEDTYESLRDAGSVGGYFARNIKGSYAGTKV